MAQLFHRSSNPLSKASIFGAIFILGAAVYVFDLIYKGPYVNEKQVIREQPVPFSHKHHVSGLGIDCRYCHSSVENAAFAGVPPLKTCMTCHSQIWTNAPVLEPLRNAFLHNQPLKWVRVNALPDFVYFDHSMHIQHGIGCTTCHGPVGDMPLTWRQETLQMKWCLQCHRNPEEFVRRKNDVFLPRYHPSADQKDLGPLLVKQYHIQKLTDCYTCHR